MTTFITLRQFATEKGTTGFQALKDALYTKTHSNGEVESVTGIKAIGRETVCLALSKNLANKSCAELAQQAGSLSVAMQKYIDGNNNERTAYILCTSAEREGIGAIAALTL